MTKRDYESTIKIQLIPVLGDIYLFRVEARYVHALKTCAGLTHSAAHTTSQRYRTELRPRGLGEATSQEASELRAGQALVPG